jgi:TPR repeat protein
MSFYEPNSKTPPENFTVPQQALWWLNKGGLAMGPEWEKAHSLCQQSEGTFEYDLVHALAHWIEGDESNAAYWYRRVGGGRTESIALEWERVVGVLG